ncbi:MAG: ABC transporter ATP-binding protein [Alphaproteobacteria bacterium]|nr:MAG: ABC transporter ATP-binding protein [Alphaproteobacteria bacterium]
MRFSKLIDPFAPAEGPPPQRLVPFIRWALAGAWKVVGLATLVSMALGVLEALGALVIGRVIDTVLGAGPERFDDTFLWSVAILIGVFLILRPLLIVASAAMTGLALAPNLFPLVLARLNRHTLGQSMRFFEDDFAGRLAQKEIQTGTALTESVVETVNAIAFALVTVAMTTIILAGVGLWLSAALAVWIAIYVVLIRRLLPLVRARSKARAAARAVVSGQIVDTLSNMSTVKLFANAEHEDRAALEAIGSFRAAAIAWGRMAVLFRGLLMTFAGLLPVTLVGGTIWLWHTGQASAGDIAMAGLLSTRIAQMTGWVSFTAMTIFSHLGEVEDGMRTLSPAHEVTDRKCAAHPRPSRGAIAFHNVSFHYGRSDGVGLSDFSLDIRPGERVALVGRSGAGKSTVTSLLLRLYDVEAGRIELDGRDIAGLTQDGLRRQIAMVRQETTMFNRSAFDNVRYGRPEAGMREVHAAARAARAHDFILGLQDREGRTGYAAHLGERGVKLSGGQRQRIALARAILKDAPILVLDEATSALDSEVEAEIQEALDRLMEGRTVIAIAHRLSTIARMDRIVVLEKGRIAEQGSHGELMARGGLYAGFWTRQSGGFIGVEAAE